MKRRFLAFVLAAVMAGSLLGAGSLTAAAEEDGVVVEETDESALVAVDTDDEETDVVYVEDGTGEDEGTSEESEAAEEDTSATEELVSEETDAADETTTDTTSDTDDEASSSDGAGASGDVEGEAASGEAAAVSEEAAEETVSESESAADEAVAAEAAAAEEEGSYSVSDFSSLTAKLNEIQSSESKTGTIELSSDISMTGNLTITGDVTLGGTNSSSMKTLKLGGDYTITVEEGASLTLKYIKIDGNSQDYNESKVNFLIVKGTLNLGKYGYIKNFKNDVSTAGQGNSGIIYVDGGTFNMTSGYIYGNSFVQGDSIVNQHDAIIYVTNGGTFNMSGGYIGYSTTYNNDLGLATIDSLYSYNAAVIVGCSDEVVTSTFNMDGGTIKMTYGGPAVLVGNLTKNTTSKQKFVMDGGTISNNYGYSEKGENSVRFYGGSVTILQGEFELNGGTISSNFYYKYGAGVSILSVGNVNFDMTGGTIYNNSARGCGGGIYVSGLSGTESNTNVKLSGGTISGNSASSGQGGGIYVVSGFTVYLYNAAIYENSAKYIGGGIWTCSTGNLRVYVKSGGAIFDNTASSTSTTYLSAGDDLAFVMHSNESWFYLASTALGGGEVAYYKDGGIAEGSSSYDSSGFYYGSTTYWNYFLGNADDSERYDSSNPGDAVTDIDVTSAGVALKAVMTDGAKEAAKASAQLVITGNTAGRGGAIGANGNVIIGEETTTFEVTKTWVDGDDESSRPESITVNLYNSASDTVVRTATLSADNDWSYTFTGLSYGDNYSYYVKEVEVEGYSSSAGEVTGDYNSGYEQTITNTLLTSVDVTKVWSDYDDADGARPGNVTFELYADGEAAGQTVTLSEDNGWTASFSDLPAYSSDGNGTVTEIDYTVVETSVDGYTTAYSDVTGSAAGGWSVTVTNTYSKTGSIMVRKTVSGSAASTTEAFSFTLTLSDTSINGTYGELTFTDGAATFELKAGENVTATDLPAGVGYEVTESDDGDYTVTSANESGTIKADTSISVTFNNHKDANTTTTTATTTTTSSSSSSSSSSSTTTTSSAQTGDSANTALWTALAVLAVVACAAVVVIYKKKHI